MARLEQEVGTRLFNRSTRRLNLTEDGQAFLIEVTEGLDKLNSSKEKLRQRHGEASGTLKVALPNSFAKHYIMPEVNPFLEQHPGLKLEMYISDYEMDLLAGGFDVAVQHGQPPETGYIFRPLGALTVVLVASPQYLALRGNPQRPADLADHDCINIRNHHGSATFAWDIVQADGAGPVTRHVPDGRCFINSQLDVTIHAAICGVGIAPCDMAHAQRYLDEGSLQIVLPDFVLAHAGDLFLLYPHRDFLPAKVRVFIDFVVAVARRRLLF